MRYFIRVKIPSNKLTAEMLNNNQQNEKTKGRQTTKETNKQKKKNVVQCEKMVAYIQVNLTLKSFRK